MRAWLAIASAAGLLAATPASAALSAPTAPTSAEPPPIIDMHIHARRFAPIGEDAPTACAPYAVWPRWDQAKPAEDGLVFNVDPPCEHPLQPVHSGEEVMTETLKIMERRNIIAMVTGMPDDVARWKAAAPDRVISGLDMRLNSSTRRPDLRAVPLEELRALHAQGRLQVMGEIMAQYEGAAPNDPRLEPWWALAEELDIPVAVHLTGGGPGDPYLGSANFRAKNGDPLLLEDVLIRHPKLRLYIMHAAWPFSDNLRALLFTHPQVYVDIAAIVHSEPRAAFYRWLQEVVEAGFGDRVMFGTDQGIWPGLIEESIKVVEEAPFLTQRQKRDILYNNAARFLRLE